MITITIKVFEVPATAEHAAGVGILLEPDKSEGTPAEIRTGEKFLYAIQLTERLVRDSSALSVAVDATDLHKAVTDGMAMFNNLRKKPKS